MLIRQVELTGVKSYMDQTVHLRPGVNAICGHNGAGKSTILEAIGFVLFDYLPYAQKEFIREGESTATVTVRFVSGKDGREYDVTRRIGRDAVYFVSDPQANVRLAEQKQDVSGWLQQHLGIAESVEMTDVYQNAIGVPQGLLTAAFLETASRRKAIFDPLLQVDEYDRSWEKLRDVERVEKDWLSEASVEIARLEGNVERLKEFQAGIDDLDEQLSSLRLQHDGVRGECDRYKRELLRLEETKVSHDEHVQAISEQESQLKVLRTRQSGLAHQLALAETARERVDACRDGHETWQAANDMLKEVSRDLEAYTVLVRNIDRVENGMVTGQKSSDLLGEQLSEIDQAQGRIELLEEEIAAREQLKLKLDGLREKRETLRSQFAAGKAAIRQIEERIEDLSQCDGSECPVCGGDLTEARAKMLITALRLGIEESQNECDTAEAQGGKLSAEIHGIEGSLSATSPEAERDQLQRRVSRRSELQQQLAELKVGMESDSVTLSNLRSKLEALGNVKDRMATIRADLDAHQKDHDEYAGKFELAAGCDGIKSENDRLSNQIDIDARSLHNLQESLAAIGFDARVCEQTRATLSRLDADLAGLDGRISTLDATLQRMQDGITQYQDAESDLGSAQARKSSIERTMEATAKIRATIKEAGPYVTLGLVKVISHEADRVYCDIMQDPTVALQWDESYGITVHHNGNTRIFKQLSGGEQMAAALSVRLAMLREMSDVDIAMFDEPTSNLDATRRNLLADQLLGIKGFSQMFVISHDDTFETTADHVIRVRKEGGRSIAE